MKHSRLKILSFPILLTLTSCQSNFAWYEISPMTKAGRSNLSFLIDGYIDTISLSLTAIFTSVMLGLFVSLCGYSKVKLVNRLSRFYIVIFRAVPIMALVLWVFYGLPIFWGINLGPFASGVLSLALSDAAFEAEIFRAGIQSVPLGQKEAAKSIGLNKWQIYKLVIIPQAIRKILPALANQFIYVLKMSAIVSVIGLTELTKKANELVVTTYRPLEIYSVLIIEYLILIVFISWIFHRLENKLRANSLKYG